MDGFVYIWFDRKHKRYYVGSHWGTENDGYICSSGWMKKSYKRRPKDFKRRIIKRNIEKYNLLDEEQRYLDMIKQEEKKIRYYNLNTITYHWNIHPVTAKKVSEKISITLTGRKQTEITKQKRSKSLIGRRRAPFTQEHLQNLSESHIGQKPWNVGIKWKKKSK